MKEKAKIEMSTIDVTLPRYYKGFDIDILIQNLFNKKPLTEKEKSALDEAMHIYHTKHDEEVGKEIEAWKKRHRGHIIKNVDPQRIIRG